MRKIASGVILFIAIIYFFGLSTTEKNHSVVIESAKKEVVINNNQIAQRKKLLIMGYRTSVREPLIKEEPDNSGLYYDLYNTVALKLNMELKVVRAPKNRILKGIKQGKIDFYPGFTFTNERSSYVYYVNNGLPGGYIGVSRKDFPEVTDLRQLVGKDYIISMGGPRLLANEEGVRVHSVPELSIAKAVKLIQDEQGDFFLYDRGSLEYFFYSREIKDLKLHYYAYKGPEPMYLGFSRKSPHYQEDNNVHYRIDKPLSVNNFPVRLSESSLAFKIERTLKSMKKSGEVQKLYDRYYKAR